MKCLRCGTELKDSDVFCPDCSKVTSVPLQPSAYMSKKAVIPKRRPSQTIKKPEGKAPVKKQRSVGRWILLSGVLLLVVALFTLQGAYNYGEKRKLEAEVLRLLSVEDECVRLTDKVRKSEAEIRALEQELSALGTDSYLAVRDELKAAQAENEELTHDLALARDELAELTQELEKVAEKAEFLDTRIVFIQDDTPTVFHTFDCEKFSHNGYRAYNKQLATSLGYTPCPHCQ